MTTPLAPAFSAAISDPLLERLRLSTAGTYDIAGELGRGGMAVVYLAHDLKLDRRVAIKVMDPRLSLTPGMSDRFLLEARIAARLQHPNIIVVHDIRQDHELSYFVMSFVEGMAADHLCQQPGPIAIDDVRWIIAGAARALAHAHSEAVVHRDIKPANILVNVKGDVILTDFGIAKALGSTSLTQSGTQVGTPSYMSPEQFTNKPVGPSSDQYSLGVTAYVLLTGRLPFSGELYQLILAHSNEVPVHVRELRPDCPPFLADAVMRMLEKDAAQRWPSLHDVADVVSESLPANGGRALAATARLAQQQRAQEVPALMALTPMSPVPAGRMTNTPSTPSVSAASTPPTPVPVPTLAPERVIAELRLDATSFDVSVGSHFTLPLRAFDASGAPMPTDGLDVLLDRPDAVSVDVATWQVDAKLPGDTRVIVAPRQAFASGATPVVRASCVVRVRAAVAEAIPAVETAPAVATPVVPTPITSAPIAPPPINPAPSSATPAATPRRTMPVVLGVAGLAAAAIAFVLYQQRANEPAALRVAAAVDSTSPVGTSAAPATSLDVASQAADSTASVGAAPTPAGAAATSTPSNVAPRGSAPVASSSRPTPPASTPGTQSSVTSAPGNRADVAARTVPTADPAVPARTEPELPKTQASSEPVNTRPAPASTEPAASAPPPVSEAPRAPSPAEMRQAASDLFIALRATKGASVREIANFFRDGNDHRLTLGAVKVLDPRDNVHRAQFELQVSKRDFSGRLAAGMTLVTFFAERRDGQVVPALESVGPLARSR